MPSDSNQNLLALKRAALKGQLLHERQTWGQHPDGGLRIGVVCVECGRMIGLTGAELHEVIIDRGEATGNHVRMLAIMDAANCAFVHPECHKSAQTNEGRRRGIERLLQWEAYAHPPATLIVGDSRSLLEVGFVQLSLFLDRVEPFFRVLIPEKRNLIREVYETALGKITAEVTGGQ